MSHQSIPNPFRHRRVWLGLKQDDLAVLSGVTRQTVTELEAGLYRKPPPSLLQALSSSESDAARLRGEYDQWVALRRLENSYSFTEDYRVNTFTSYTTSVGGSLRGFCRALVIQRSLVQHYLSVGANWETIENCLWAVGLSGIYTQWLRKLPRA